jgi:site-specific DNA-methyltransferase (adenine-specific)
MSVEITEGDCLEVLKGMKAGSVDAVITDPPYGMNYKGAGTVKQGKFTDITNDATFDKEWQTAWMRACYRVLKDDRHFYCFCSEHHVGEFREAIVEAGFNLKRMLVWYKKRSGVNREALGGYLPTTELILFAHKGQRDLIRGPQQNLLDIAGIAKMEFHPTEKPPGVLRPLILNSTKEGETVLDPFAGSGSLGVAAKEENRGAILIELEPKYVEYMTSRLAQEGLF